MAQETNKKKAKYDEVGPQTRYFSYLPAYLQKVSLSRRESLQSNPEWKQDEYTVQNLRNLKSTI